jgi:hypothetical protein
MRELHTLDAFATFQGGFDSYFSSVDYEYGELEEGQEAKWEMAQANLADHGLYNAAHLLARAHILFAAHLDELNLNPYDDETAYLEAMRALDAEWRTHVPAIHVLLAPWRDANGLSDFTTGR